MQETQAFDIVRRSFRNGRLPHAYLVIGAPRGAGGEFVRRVAGLLLCERTAEEAPCGACDGCVRVSRGVHPDVLTIEPEKKSRIISIDAMRDPFLLWASEKSFSGGWKVGVVLFADRLKDAAANAFLKTLEEPPPDTLFLLVSDRPDDLLPTIVSRCQRLDLSTGRIPPPEPVRSRVGEILASHSAASGLRAAATAARLHAVFEDLHERAETEIADELREQANADPEAWTAPDSDIRKGLVGAREKEGRRAVYQSIQEWYRDLLLFAARAESGAPPPTRSALCFPEHRDVLAARAAGLPVRLAARFIEFTQEIEQRIEERNLPDLHIFLHFFSWLR